MKEIIRWAATELDEAGFQTARVEVEHKDNVLAFEDPTAMGFVFAYENAGVLLASWSSDLDAITSGYRFHFRKAVEKAWNVYAIFLAESPAEHPDSVGLTAIEENLVGTRKIVRAGVVSQEDARAALLPLLPLQTAPQLETIDIKSEIRQRSSTLSKRAIDAFLSDASEQIVLQVLEERQ